MKIPTAARKDQKKRSLPWPNGCSASGGRSPSASENSRKIWFIVSAIEWAASANMADEPDTSPAASLATAIDALAPSAMSTVRRAALCPPLPDISASRCARRRPRSRGRR